ncbi:YmfQ family protein [Bacillus massiliigorillae]|uniref:YmfQ family protein n=1 Tax=Bacillus massiliigorillae TaxID=1243664 RepID=UPI0003A27F48|nr:YmfQ family protein [Bacillus massiliigorillae]
MSDYKRDIKQSMMNYLPYYYRDIREANEIIRVESEMIDQLNADIQDLLLQFSVETATWGLSRWEKLCGIKTDESKPIDQRRSVVRSKLRGIGTVTVDLVKNVAESYLNGEVEVVENSAEYTILIRFVGKLGIPPNLDDIKNALREIIPAHLLIDYEFTFTTWDRFDSFNYTWDQIDALNKTWDEVEVM